MTIYTDHTGNKYNVEHYIASLPQHQSRLLRSLWADLNTMRTAANKSLALATEGLALVEQLDTDNQRLRAELARAYDRLDRYELVK